MYVVDIMLPATSLSQVIQTLSIRSIAYLLLRFLVNTLFLKVLQYTVTTYIYIARTLKFLLAPSS